MGDTGERDHSFNLSGITKLFERTGYISGVGSASGVQTLSIGDSNCYGAYLRNISAEDSGLISGALYVQPALNSTMLSAFIKNWSGNWSALTLGWSGDSGVNSACGAAACFPIMIPEGHALFFRANSAVNTLYLYSEYGVTYEFTAFGV